MNGIQINAKHQLEEVTSTEALDAENYVKIKITRSLFTSEDFTTLSGDNTAKYPVIPSRVGVGKVVEVNGSAPFDMERGTRVFPHPVTACGKCYECLKSDEEHCSAFQVAGKNADGFLRDFVLYPTDCVSVLPPTVKDNQALLIDHIALCDKIVDKLNLQKGEHVIIVGGDVLGIILAQLIVYYQGIPILIDNSDNNIILAKNAGIYYTLFADNKIEKNVADLTGARLAKKVVYMTGSNLNTDIALKLAGHNATVCFAGFGAPAIRVNFNSAIIKQLNFICVNNGFGSIDSAINLLANKAVDTDVFNLPTVQSAQAKDKILEMAQQSTAGAYSKNLIVIDE